MNSFSLGDLAQTFMLQRRGAALKTDMTRLNEELATGQVSDVKSVLAGNISYLTDIEGDLKSLSGYRIATSEATQFADSTQLALDRIDATVGNLSTTLITLSSNAVEPVLDQFSSQAKTDLETVVSALNTTTGGRALFAGNATDQRAVNDVDVILSGLRTATAGATSAQDIMLAAENWFNDPSGFEATAYGGANTTLEPFRLRDGETVQMGLTANDSMFRDMLKNISVAAIANDASFALDWADQRALLEDAGQELYQSQSEVTAARADIGSAQARIDTLATRNSTEENALLSAKAALLQVDPYEAATELEAVQFQLQSLYTVTARMSDMSFVNYFR